MTLPGSRGFIPGLLLGTLFSLVFGSLGFYLLVYQEIISVTLPDWTQSRVLLDWLGRNFGLSLIPFALTLGLFVSTLQKLAWHLERGSALNVIARFEHLADVWTGLFFGIGVIWTAIGMRSALIHALGDPHAAASLDAFTVLQRLVDGGILTALTTTILGGVGGYLMRVAKSFFLGARLSLFYEQQEQRRALRIEQLLEDIRGSVSESNRFMVPVAQQQALRK